MNLKPLLASMRQKTSLLSNVEVCDITHNHISLLDDPKFEVFSTGNGFIDINVKSVAPSKHSNGFGFRLFELPTTGKSCWVSELYLIKEMIKMGDEFIKLLLELTKEMGFTYLLVDAKSVSENLNQFLVDNGFKRLIDLQLNTTIYYINLQGDEKGI